MHWIIQKSIFKPVNYNLLTDALDSLGISYTPVYIPNGTYDLQPEILDKKNVYVCGAIMMLYLENVHQLILLNLTISLLGHLKIIKHLMVQ